MTQRQGTETKEKCPKCGGVIVYNGNYFCDNWTYPVLNFDEGECDWALPQPPELDRDKEISIKLMGYWEEELPNCGGFVKHYKLD